VSLISLLRVFLVFLNQYSDLTTYRTTGKSYWVISPARGRDISIASTPTLGLALTRSKRVIQAKRPQREGDNSSECRAEVKKAWVIRPPPPLYVVLLLTRGQLALFLSLSR